MPRKDITRLLLSEAEKSSVYPSERAFIKASKMIIEEYSGNDHIDAICKDIEDQLFNIGISRKFIRTD